MSSLLVTPCEWTIERCVWSDEALAVVCSSSINCRAINVSYVPRPHVPTVDAVLFYWWLAVIDLISSLTAVTVSDLYTCRLCCYCIMQCLLVSLVRVAVPWIAFIVCWPHLPDSQHVIWCSPLACNWTVSLPLSPPPAVNKPTWLHIS